MVVAKFQHRLDECWKRSRASTIARFKEAPSSMRFCDSMNRSVASSKAYVVVVSRLGDVLVLSWTKIRRILSMMSGEMTDAPPLDKHSHSWSSTSPWPSAPQWIMTNANDTPRTDFARSKERWEYQVVDQRDRQEHVAINSEMPPWRSPPVWEWSWGRIICRDDAPTIPAMHHSKQVLTLPIELENEVPHPSCRRSGKGRKRD
jgi:hypothetical protein